METGGRSTPAATVRLVRNGPPAATGGRGEGPGLPEPVTFTPADDIDPRNEFIPYGKGKIMEEIVETKKTKMSIARALKEKERIGKKLLEARNELKEFNCIDRKEHPDVNQQEIFDRVQALEPKYLKIRQTIATANMGITDQLTEMLIIRARITFYTVLDCRTSETVNKFLPGRPGMRDCEQTRVEYDTFIDRKKRSEILEQLQSRLYELQDEVDQFNATHMVEVEI